MKKEIRGIGVNMKKEFNLSEKIFTLSNLNISGGAKFLEPKDIKEFIKRLKEEIWDKCDNYEYSAPIIMLIDKLAGKELK